MITLADEITQIGQAFYHSEIGLIASYPRSVIARYRFALDYPEFAYVQMAFMSTRPLESDR